ncbi:FHA domain-containing protein [Cellulomonas hominis]
MTAALTGPASEGANDPASGVANAPANDPANAPVPEYLPGDWYAVVSGGLLGLLSPRTSPEAVRAVWRAGAGPDALTRGLDALLRGGLSALEPFALVDLATGRLHAAMRGDVEVVLGGPTASAVLVPGDVSTWSEQVSDAADEVLLRVTGAGTWAGDATLPLVGGVVLARGLRVPLGSGRAAGVAAAAAVEVARAQGVMEADGTDDAGLAGARQVGAEQVGAEQVGAEQVGAGTVSPPSAEDPAAGLSELATPETSAWFAELDESLAAVLGEDVRGPGGPLLGAVGLVGARPGLFDPAGLTSATEAPTTAPAQDGTQVRLDKPLWGSEPPPPPPAPDDHDGLNAPAAPDDHDGLNAPAAPDDHDGLNAPAAPDDHDGLTILSGELVAIREQLPAWAMDQTGDPPPVVAPLAPVTAKVVVSTGAVVSLDRAVLIGRAPQASRLSNRDLPRMVAVPSPQHDISRTHAEVRMEGSDVLVTDLHSTNGVLLGRPGGSQRRLHPGEPTLLSDGEVADLGDGVTFTVERGA